MTIGHRAESSLTVDSHSLAPAASPLVDATTHLPFMIIDGAMATELERMGHDLNDALWSARVLRDSPESIRAVHRTYFEAGADCAITASYQATREGFMRAGLDAEQADTLIRRSVTLAREARDAYWSEQVGDSRRRYPLVAASVGPYGAFLADGSEYRGNYSIGRAALADFHRPRLRTLLEAGPDLLAVETLPSLEEALAVAGLLPEFPGAWAWFTFSARDAEHISDGTPIDACVRALTDLPGVAAIGINCTALSPVEELVSRLRARTCLPIVVYPNSGESYDPVTRTWHAGCGSASEGSLVDGLSGGAARWLAAGASAIGGCCRTGPADIRALTALRQQRMER